MNFVNLAELNLHAQPWSVSTDLKTVPAVPGSHGSCPFVRVAMTTRRNPSSHAPVLRMAFACQGQAPSNYYYYYYYYDYYYHYYDYYYSYDLSLIHI